MIFQLIVKLMMEMDTILMLHKFLVEDVIEHVDKSLIQVRCSLEDVADNMVGSQIARGEKEPQVVRNLCETLTKTGASCEIVGTTMMGSLKKVVTKPECDIMKDVGRSLKDVGNFESKFNH